MKVKGKGFQHCVKYEFQPRKVRPKKKNFLSYNSHGIFEGKKKKKQH